MDLNDNALSGRFVCPYIRILKCLDTGEMRGETHYKVMSPYYISDAKNDDTHRLFICDNTKGNNYNLRCVACPKSIIDATYYSCKYCCLVFHTECVESPSLFWSPNHPKHSLQLILSSRWKDTENKCCCCGISDAILYYYCYICDIFFHLVCAKNSTPLTINHRKRHEHTLYYFQRLSALVCNVCGLDDKCFIYICLQCDFIVHKRCINSPNIIKMSRHNHRLAFTGNLSLKEFPCGLCHRKINQNYGSYSCTKGCNYVVHSRCVLRRDICDGKELEEVSEEIYEEIKPFEEIGNGIIQHSLHMHHHMRLEEQTKTIYDENKRCEACILPFYDANAYNCVECDFSLHKTCAYIPQVKQSILHIHPLILKNIGIFTCRKCDRYSNGLAYVCDIRECMMSLDVRCASISEPLDHHFHEHPLFLTYEYSTQNKCSICERTPNQPLYCVKCYFVICFRCATTPYNMRYKHDDHLLKFSYEKDANERFYWCDKCEKMLNPRNGFYGCNECGVTLHVECLLGEDLYLKCGYMNNITTMIEVIPNNNCLMRSICKQCGKRCSSNIKIIESNSKDVFCSIKCSRGY